MTAVTAVTGNRPSVLGLNYPVFRDSWVEDTQGADAGYRLPRLLRSAMGRSPCQACRASERRGEGVSASATMRRQPFGSSRWLPTH
jgi:hypothetical protein